MKNIKSKYRLNLLLGLILVIGVSCERDLSEDVEFATNPATADIFTDAPIGMGTNFYFPYGGSKPTAWSVDENESYLGSASMRFDVPNANDPEGNYAGAIFRIDGAGRDLTGFDALTFWAKGSQAVTIAEIGFGEDFGENKFVTTRPNLSLTTNWVKYIIPIPEPSKLFQERGMLRYAAAGIGPLGSEVGYTFWLDEVRFEKLGTLAQAQPAIFNGEDRLANGFTGIDFNISGLTQTFNAASGMNLTVNAAPAYFDFQSSNEDVAFVSEFGIATIVAEGTTNITASIAGVPANGSLELTSTGAFDFAPTPTRPAANVISIFSDAYDNVPVDYYNGFFTPDGQTTLGGAPPAEFGDEEIINYTDLNFVGIGTFLNVAPVNASAMTHIHVDINVREALNSGDFIRFQLINDVGGAESSGSVTFSSSQLVSDGWASFDISLDDFSGLASRDKLGLIFFISDSTISNIFVDNIYYYSE
ncbi:MAG: carbohydrate-binding protein [Bacteroidia bacterium]|nr:carbohydrate-binding protein [Bacteroidia bacterium]